MELLQRVFVALLFMALMAAQFLLVRSPGVVLVPVTEPSIQGALDRAEPNTRILVDARKGPYRENIIVRKSRVTIESWYGKAVLLGEEESEPVVTILADEVRFSGFVVRGGATGILLSDANRVSVANSVVTENLQGISLNRSHDNDIHDNEVAGNRSIGILLHASNGSHLERNRVRENRVGGLFLEGGSTGNHIAFNQFVMNGVGIRLLSSPANFARGNRFAGQKDVGMSAESSPGVRVIENIFSSNGVGIHLANATQTILSGNLIEGNEVGVLIQGSINELLIEQNVWTGNHEVALKSEAEEPVQATHNYWGSPAGPRRDPDDSRGGELVMGLVAVDPWQVEP